jgi:hypothetical protein
MVNLGNKLLRINPKDARKLEYSTNGGRVWITIFNGMSAVGTFQDLLANGKELLATTDKGLFYSTNEGRVWIKRN